MFLSWLTTVCGRIGGSACESVLSSHKVRFAHKPKDGSPHRQRAWRFGRLRKEAVLGLKTQLLPKWESRSLPERQAPADYLLNTSAPKIAQRAMRILLSKLVILSSDFARSACCFSSIAAPVVADYTRRNATGNPLRCLSCCPRLP